MTTRTIYREIQTLRLAGVPIGEEEGKSYIGYGTLMNQMQYAYADAQRLEQLNNKLYLINSDGFPANETGLKSHCKNGFQVETIAETGHYPMIEKPAEFNLILEKVLAGMK